MADQAPGDVPAGLEEQVARGVPERVLGLISHVRRILRDYPQLNRLTRGHEHSAKSIATAMIRAVDFWNSANPPVSTYTVTNFPYREILTTGTIAYLCESLYYLAERNELRYTDGQVSIAPRDRRMLLQLNQAKMAEFRRDVADKKMAENLQQSMGRRGVPSEYDLVNNWIDYLE